MQEEMERKAVAISIKAGKLTADLLKAALRKALAEMEKSQKNPKIYHGKQSVKQLVRQGAGVSNIEVTDGNIKSFERVARKYGVDFALKKDVSSQPPRYLVFFKSRDADALTAAFAEYSGKVVQRRGKEKPSIRRQLAQLRDMIQDTALLLFASVLFLSGGVAASPCAKGKGFREWKGMESVLDKSVIDCSLLNISLFNCVGFSNVGFSCVGFSNVGLSNVGFSNVGKSNIGGCPPLVAASGSRGCGCSYMT